ncbi:three component ABC system middle component [uncultured Sphaerochaeta sp.]|jgi:hypothetical protein|uniref:three component ABC system middle component n=1 Tax=uncultured Sphaerochaeta sp. TaxID=886478 RepID=UPI0029CAA11F|nr:three component ABC system middle component [uncultured Sphaerochaeta sp.]
MEPWNKRLFEYRRLFNPAFCALVLLRAINGYKEVSGKGMPFSLLFLVLPLCLFEDSRIILKKNNRGNFQKIISTYPEILVGFPKRASALASYTMEGLGYAHHRGLFSIEEGAMLISGNVLKSSYSGSLEVQDCQKVAYNLGKKFAKVGSKITIFTILGVRP